MDQWIFGPVLTKFTFYNTAALWDMKQFLNYMNVNNMLFHSFVSPKIV